MGLWNEGFIIKDWNGKGNMGKGGEGKILCFIQGQV